MILLISSHAKCALSDPGHVPVPEARIDFSDTNSLQTREDDWTVCQVNIKNKNQRWFVSRHKNDPNCPRKINDLYLQWFPSNNLQPRKIGLIATEKNFVRLIATNFF